MKKSEKFFLLNIPDLLLHVCSDLGLAQLPVELLEAAEEGEAEAPRHHVSALRSLLTLVLTSAPLRLPSKHLDHLAPAAVLTRGPAHVHVMSVTHVLDVLRDAGVSPDPVLVHQGDQLAFLRSHFNSISKSRHGSY